MARTGFSKTNTIRLGKWEEASGHFAGARRIDGGLLVGLEIRRQVCLIFESEEESKSISTAIGKIAIGDCVSILRTDIPEKPVVLRVARAARNEARSEF